MSRKTHRRNGRDAKERRKTRAADRNAEYDALSVTARQLREAENFEKYQADISDRFEKMY